MARLTTEQVTRLKQILNTHYQVLLEEIRDELERSGERQYIELAGRVTDIADRSTADMLADLGAAIVDRHIQALRELEAALARLEAGRFGECSECGGEIEYERLLVFPTAKRCLRCQGVHEKTYARESSPSL